MHMIVGQQLLVAGVAMKMQAPGAARAAGGSEQQLQLQLQLQLQPNQRSINQRRSACEFAGPSLSSPLLSSPLLSSPAMLFYLYKYIYHI
jgi:hypothetical protein